MNAARQEPSRGAAEAAEFDGAPDPWSALVRSYTAGRYGNSVLLGLADNGFVLSKEAQNTLVLGPPQTAKTTGVLAPAAMAHPGPLIVVSTKSDVMAWTAVVRSRQGRLWHYAVDGSPTAPGCIPLRWSPVAAAVTGDHARRVASALVRASANSHDHSHQFWRDLASKYLACLLYAAYLHGGDITWVISAAEGQRKALEDADEWLLDAERPDARRASERLAGVLSTHAEGLSSIRLSATHALDVYTSDAAVATTLDPNFDAGAFVEGEPDRINPWAMWNKLSFNVARKGVAPCPGVGYADTIYVTAGTADQARVAPLIVALLHVIRDARYQLHQEDAAVGYRGRRDTLFLLDELAGLAPDPDYTAMLRECASQGLLVMSCLQDLSQAEAKWGSEAEGFLTLHQELVVFSGIRNDKTLRALSTVMGERWVRNHTLSTSHQLGGRPGSSWNENEQLQRMPVLDPGQICHGDPTDPRKVLLIRPSGMGRGYAHPMPAWIAPPWPRLLISSMDFVAQNTAPGDFRASLPLPDLGRTDQNGKPWLLRQRNGAALLDQYESLVDWFACHRETTTGDQDSGGDVAVSA